MHAIGSASATIESSFRLTEVSDFCYLIVMSLENPLQHDMFTGELIDTRTARQKERDNKHMMPRQSEMFATHEVAQFGVNSRPLIPIASQTRLVLIREDRRTPEEIERDRQRETEMKTQHLFANSSTAE